MQEKLQRKVIKGAFQNCRIKRQILCLRLRRICLSDQMAQLKENYLV